MSYNIHWTSSAISKNENVYQLDIYDKDYTGDPITVPVGEQPFVIKANAASDNQYEALLASELRVVLNITNTQEDFIDFSNEDQFKYFGILSYDDNIVFQGWLLPDAMTMPFSTGEVECGFSFIDGLAMLKTIYYTPSNLNTSILENTRQTIQNCINALNYPFGYNINIAVSIFAGGMQNRTADIKNEPLSQSYMYVNNWFNSSQITTPNIDPFYYSDFISCYEILEYIITGWGCQLFQANGEWYVANVNEMASDNIYVTKYDETGTYISASNSHINYTIKPYDGQDELYFVDNSQAKILRQGFSQIYFTTKSEFAVNYIDNGYLRRLTGGVPYGWLTQTNGTGAVTFSTGEIANFYNLTYSSVGTFDSFAGVRPIYTKYVCLGDIMDVKFNYKLIDNPIDEKPICTVKIEIIYGSTTYYYSKNETWEIAGANPEYYQPTGDLTPNKVNSISFSTAPIPVTGQYYFSVRVNPPQTGLLQTQTSIDVSVFSITFSNNFSYNLVSVQKETTFQNKKTVDGYIGARFGENFNSIGAIMDISGLNVYSYWYRQPEAGTGYYSINLVGIIAEDYFFTQSKAQINVSGSLMSLMSKKTGESTKSHLSLFASIKVLDTSLGPNNITEKYYIMGNCELDLIEDTLNGATLLEASNVRIPNIIKNANFTVEQ